MATYDSPEADPRVPAAAAAIVGLLNSRPHATPALPDGLDDPGEATAILSRFAPAAPGAPTADQLDRVRAIRDDLMAVLAADTPARTAQAWTALTERSGDLTFRQTFSPEGQARLRPATGDPLAAEILLLVAELTAANTWSRVRICANEMCSHVFYDTTRSRTQRWHSYEMCGNRTNVAAYRARSRERA
ncbi:CGNR zinc finger domain-containing protein [Micromonospora sp. NPDC049366]|uniref:CGNR zinc finger domain-containing protein n=1 Tax=Micromonospora sp. NPDC049366 TaxID=3364271 RepID=UPI0037A81440